MNILVSMLAKLFRKYNLHDLNVISTNVYCGDYTLHQAIVIFRLNLKDVEYIAKCIQEYNAHEQYINQRTRGTI